MIQEEPIECYQNDQLHQVLLLDVVLQWEFVLLTFDQNMGSCTVPEGQLKSTVDVGATT